MSTKLKHSKTAFKEASESIDSMKASQNFDEFEKYWKHFLSALQKCNEKSRLETELLKFPKFQAWNQLQRNKMSKDPLLNYLTQCNNSEKHSIEEIILKIPGERGIGIREGRIDYMYIDEGVIKDFEGNAVIEFINRPQRVKTKSVTNRGVAFPPPIFHNGKSIKNPDNPVEIAEFGLKFYESYLNEVETKWLSQL